MLAAESFETVARAASRVLEQAGRATARLQHRDLSIRRFSEWNATLDEALGQLPEPEGCTREFYRELVLPTSVAKQHALVTDNDGPLAVVSVRRRGRRWEPVAYQCLPGVVAPARSLPDLGRSMHRLGADVLVEAGLSADMALADPTVFYPYEVRQIDLTGDYEAYWKSKGLHKNTKRAAKRCAEMDIHVDRDGGIARAVEMWRMAWADDPTQEAVAAMDRERFWTALHNDETSSGPRVLTLELFDGERMVAGTVSFMVDDRLLLQCLARDSEYDRQMVGTRIIEATVEWAVANGCQLVDFGAGDGYKRWWAPHTTKRYGAVFRPPLSSLALATARTGQASLNSLSHWMESSRAAFRRTDPQEE